MRYTTLFTMASAVALGGANPVRADAFQGNVLEARQAANWKVGDCYSSPGDLTKNGTYTYQTSGACIDQIAKPKGAKVVALFNGDTCYYGNSLPPDNDKVDMSECSTKCNAFEESCGGPKAYLVWSDVGFSGNAPSAQDSSSSAPPTTTSAPPTVATTVAGGTTIVVTNSPDSATATVSVMPTASPENSGSGTSKAGIAAGVVVGVVGLAAIVGGAFLFMRSKKQKAEAAELQRQNSSAGFASRGEKPPSTYSLSDSRLEPTFMRRMSDGSIADNQDYSRRILKVTNPDDR